MTDETKPKELVEQPVQPPKSEVEPLLDSEMEGVAGGAMRYCSAAACSG